jgi:RimJ/RimL family protein N-acetyltransferase
MADWPAAERIETPRLRLEPLTVGHADEMAQILDDVSLHEYTGGRPETLEQLRARYARQAAGRSPDGAQGWLNWILRRRDTNAIAGTVQATLSDDGGRRTALLAWVIASEHQRNGFAREAAQAMVAWLRGHGVEVFAAHIHPRHAASIAVAEHLGMRAGETGSDGEVRWSSSPI